MAVTFVFGYFIMEKLDRVLENSHHAAVLYLQSEENRIRTSFSDSLTAESIADAPDKLAKTQHVKTVVLMSRGEGK